MTSHDVARLLNDLADLLYAGPDIPIGELRTASKRSAKPSHPREIAVNIGTLAALSKIDKAQWLQVIEMFKLPIEVRPRDASRDIIGKILAYLDAHPDEQKRMSSGSQRLSSEGSPELLKALSFLLKDTDRDSTK